VVGVGVALSLGVEEGEAGGAAVGDGMAASRLDVRRGPEGAACDRPPAAPGDEGKVPALDLSAEGTTPVSRGGTRSSDLLAVGLGSPGTSVSGLTGPPVRLTTRTIGYPAHKAPTP
jgi:hypothetical protein